MSLILLPGEKEAFEVIIDPVPDPFKSIEAQVKCVESIKREMYSIHSYFFTKAGRTWSVAAI